MEDHQDSSSSSFFLLEDKHALFARLLTSPFSSDHHVYKIASPIPLGFGTNGTVFSGFFSCPLFLGFLSSYL